MDLRKKLVGLPFSLGDVLLVTLGLVFLGSLVSAHGSAFRFAEAFVKYVLVLCLGAGAIAVTIVLGGNAVAAVSHRRAQGRVRARRGKPSRDRAKKKV